MKKNLSEILKSEFFTLCSDSNEFLYLKRKNTSIAKAKRLNAQATDGVRYAAIFEPIVTFDDLSVSTQEEIAIHWLQWQIAETGDTTLLAEVLDVEESIWVLNGLLRDNNTELLQESILNYYRDTVEAAYSEATGSLGVV